METTAAGNDQTATGASRAAESWFERVQRLMDAPYCTFLGHPIELIQTHISVVLLGQRYVLKLKKPLDLGFLDYTTVENRRVACQAEVDLNSRLCPDIYLSAVPVRVCPGGQFSITGDGEILDYAVLMKRLPTEMMLDELIARDEVTESMIDRIADRLSAFHASAATGASISKYGQPELIRVNWDENFSQTSPYIDRTVSSIDFETIRQSTARWLQSLEGLMRDRVRKGWVREGHGDIRCESICVADGISIYDCIEFNKRFRCGDVASEVAFLAVDMHSRGRPDLGYYFASKYGQLAGDEQLFDLLPFYRCYRAYVRGKVLSFRLDETEFTREEQALSETRARAYFQLARRYATPLTEPTVVTVTGLSGTGKTTLARAIAEELGTRVVSSDEVRKSLFNSGEREPGYGEGIYTAEASVRTYQEMFERARGILSRHGVVILDATFNCRRDREDAHEMARASGARLRSIECHAPDQEIRQRLERRRVKHEGLSDATWQTYLRQQEERERGATLPSDSHLALDMTGSLRLASYKATDWLRDRAGGDSALHLH